MYSMVQSFAVFWQDLKQIWSPMRFDLRSHGLTGSPGCPCCDHVTWPGLFTISTWPSFGPELGLLPTGPEGARAHEPVAVDSWTVYQCLPTSGTCQLFTYFTSRFINIYQHLSNFIEVYRGSPSFHEQYPSTSIFHEVFQFSVNTNHKARWVYQPSMKFPEKAWPWLSPRSVWLWWVALALANPPWPWPCSAFVPWRRVGGVDLFLGLYVRLKKWSETFFRWY